jgi:hypothetical protein
MVARGNLRHCLLLLLAVSIAAQALALAAHHPPFPIVKAAPSGGDPGDRHDPVSCNLCQILSQVRVQAPAPAGYAVPTIALERSAFAPAPCTRSSVPELSASSPRAPPSSSIS